MRNHARELAAKIAALSIDSIGQHETRTAIVLGTGWGDALDMDVLSEWSLKDIPGFDSLGDLAGHKRKLIYGKIGDEYVWILSGRVHLNEAPDNPNIYSMVRLQIEMLFHLGVRKLILTNAAGSLSEVVKVGDIVIADGFVTLFAPDMPLWAGEFCSPEDSLDYNLIKSATVASFGLIEAYKGAYAMVRGPFFEGRRYDKRILKNTGATVIGMSTLPEACVASLYKDLGVKVVCLSFVTNTDSEEHSHEENLKRAKESSAKLGQYLKNILSEIDREERIEEVYSQNVEDQ